MKFLVVVVGAGALAVLGALICVIASVYPRKRLSLGDNGTVTEGPGTIVGPEAVAQAGPLGALHGGHALGGLDLELSLNELGGAPLNPLSFSRLLCTPLPPGDCRGEGGLGGGQGRIQADDPRGEREEWSGLRATADELQQVIVQQNQQILMDQRTIRELTGKLSECESGLEEEAGPEGAGPPGAGSVGLWAGDEMGSTQRAVEELARAIMELKDRIEKLEAEIGPAALNRSEFLSAPKPRPPPPPAPGPAHRPAHPHRPSGKAPPARTKAPKAPWRVEDLEGELERKIKLLAKERQAMRKEGAGEAGPGDFTDRRPGTGDHPGTADRAEQGMAEPEQNPGGEGERQHPLVEPSFPDGFVLSFPMRTSYMYGVVRREVTEMYAFTACLWLRPLESGIGTPFSYSVPGQPNELVLLQGAHNPVELLINDKVAQLPLELTRNRWQHICVSWTLRDGVWKAYQGGKLRGRGEGLAAWHPIKPGGVLILGQEQDTVGGRFDASQALVGELSQFNLWDRVLRPAEVQALSECSSPALGNIAPWTDHDVDVYGGATKESGEPCTADRKTASSNL